LVGPAVLQELLQRGRQVTALARDPAAPAGMPAQDAR
jgi:uncharacterized protein YbjT (DUF2867 family)